MLPIHWLWSLQRNETEDEPHRPTIPFLVGNAYGRVDAPLLFYKELTKHLHEPNFRTHPLEPCIFILESSVGEKRILHGMSGTRVDDGIGGGDSYFHKQLKELEKRLPFGSLKYGYSWNSCLTSALRHLRKNVSTESK